MYKKYAILVGILMVLLLVACGEQKTQKPAQPAFTAEVKEIDSMYVAGMAKMGPYSDFGKSMMELGAWLTKNKVMPTGMPFGVYYDNPATVKPESTRYEVWIPVPAKTKGDKAVVVKKFGPALIASTMYMGPYDKLPTVYPNLMEWITKNNFEIAGPAHEFYFNSPDRVPAESLKTEIAFPVKPKVPAQPAGGQK